MIDISVTEILKNQTDNAPVSHSDSICYLSAVDAIKLFKLGELSPVDLMQAIITRAEEVEPVINAFSHTFFDEALKAAHEAEYRYGNGTARPLEGIPLAVKNEVDHKGRPNTNGCLLMKDNIATGTAIFLQRLLDAGAIPHARSNVPEFCLHSCTWSKLHGVTRNPWNTKYSVGGSSGGSGAALAAGTATLATGSDIGGSIRIPASQNGVVGFKPPYGRVPALPPWNFDYYCHDGPMARTVADTILFQNLIAGPHEEDIVSLYPKLTLPNHFANIEGMRIAYTLDFGYRDVDDDVRSNTLKALEKLHDQGAIVEEIELNWSKECEEAAMAHLTFLAGNKTRLELEEMGVTHESGELTPYIARFLQDTKKTTFEDFFNGKNVEGEMYKDIGRLFISFDALICPTISIASVSADWDISEPLLINGNVQEQTPFANALTAYFNILSRCPVVNMPSGYDRNHVPTGIQIVAPTYRDEIAFQVAAACEARTGFFVGDAFPQI